jgi:hypothetical protein
MYIITDANNDFICAISTNAKINEDGSIYDINEDTYYPGGQFLLYENVELPEGIHPYLYYYTKETGFQKAFSQHDIYKIKLFQIEAAQQERQAATTVKKLSQDFINQKADLDNNIKKISENESLNSDDIVLLKNTICDMYEMLLLLVNAEEE